MGRINGPRCGLLHVRCAFAHAFVKKKRWVADAEFVCDVLTCCYPTLLPQLARARRNVVIFGDYRHLETQLPWAGLCAAARVCAGAGNEGEDGGEGSVGAGGGRGWRQAAWELLR